MTKNDQAFRDGESSGLGAAIDGEVVPAPPGASRARFTLRDKLSVMALVLAAGAVLALAGWYAFGEWDAAVVGLAVGASLGIWGAGRWLLGVDAWTGAGRVRARRPPGVWLLTISAALLAGLFPIALTLVIYFQGWSQAGVPFVELLPVLLFGASIIVASVGAWRGKNTGRVTLLLLLAVHHGMLIRSNASILTAGPETETIAYLAWGRAIRSMIWIGIYSWYLTSRRVQGFYTGPSVPKDSESG